MPPTYQDPFTWSPHHYAMIELGERQGDQLAVCVAHEGRHPFYMDGCHEIPKGLSKLERVGIYARSLGIEPTPAPAGIDEDRLAEALGEAIVSALRKARQERQPESTTIHPKSTMSGRQPPDPPSTKPRRVLDLDDDS